MERALAFRIVFRTDVPDILAKGAWCRSEAKSADYVTIGNPDLIAKSLRTEVRAGPRGPLSDYVRFYFTPRSMMLMNILTGYNGVEKRAPKDIVFLVTSVPRLVQQRVTFVFTDGHAHMADTRFSTDPEQLDRIDWDILRHSDFQLTSDDRDKGRRYQAELLVHRRVRAEALLGLACFNNAVKEELEEAVTAANLDLKVGVRDSWYPL